MIAVNSQTLRPQRHAPIIVYQMAKQRILILVLAAALGFGAIVVLAYEHWSGFFALIGVLFLIHPEPRGRLFQG